VPRAGFAALALLVLAAGTAACGDDDDGEPIAGSGSAAGDGAGRGGQDRDASAHGGSDGGPPSAPVCDVDPPTQCTDPMPTYADVAPIFQQRCLGCHDGRGDEWPLTSYGHVADWFIQIRDAMNRCAMPPPDSGITMPTAERELILLWLRCGFPR
jgi:hypothetical protein